MVEKLTILVVDDDNDLLTATARIIEKTGHRVLTANDGLQGLEIVKQRHPDMVLSDVDMPRMSGLEMCKTIKTDPNLSHIFVALITASKKDDKTQASALSKTADAYLLRPIPNAVLKGWVEAFTRTVLSEKALLKSHQRQDFLNAILFSIRKINKLINHDPEPGHLARQTCELLVSSAGYAGAWIALYGPDSKLEHLAMSGNFSQNQEALTARLSHRQTIPCPTFYDHQNSFTIVDSPGKSCHACALSEKLADRGSYCARLQAGGKYYGNITVSLPKSLTDDAQSKELFAELISDLSYALQRHEQNLEKKRIEQENTLYNKMVTTSNHNMSVIGKDYRYVMANDEFKSHFWPNSGDIKGKHVAEVLGEDFFKHTAKKNIDQALKGKPARVLTHLKNARGKELTFSVDVLPHISETGKINQVIINEVDISELRLKEQMLIDNERNLKTLLNNLPSVIFRCHNEPVWDMDYLSEGFEKLTGYKPNEVFKTNALDLANIIHPDDRQPALEKIKDGLKKEGRFSVEFRIITKKNKLLWVFESGEILSTDNNAHGFIQGMLLDITDRKEAEIDLYKSQQRFKGIIESTPDVSIQGYKPDGTVVYWNKASEILYGYSPEEALGKKLTDLIIPPKMRSLVKQAIKQAAKTGQMPPQEELVLHKKGGEPIHVLSNHAVVSYPNEEPELFCLDVSLEERKKMEQALLSSGERFERLFNASPVPLFEEDFTEVLVYLRKLHNKAGKDLEAYFDSHPKQLITCAGKVKLLNVNQAAIELHQAADKDDLIENFEKNFTPKSLEVFKKEMIALAEGKTVFETEAEVQTFRGKKRQVALRMVLLPNKEERDIGIVATTDITENKEAEKAVKQSEKKFRSLFNLSSDALFIQNFENEIIEVNETASTLLGYTREEFFKHTVAEFQHDKSPEELAEITQTLLKDGFAIFENRLKTKKGDLMPVEVAAKLIEYQGKSVALTQVRDISDRIKSQEALRQSEEKFRSLFNLSSDALVIQDLNRKILEVNDTTLEIFGYSRKELIKRKVVDFQDEMSPEDVQQLTKDLITKGFSIGEYRIRNKQGQVIPVEVSSKIIAYHGQRMILSQVRDITARKEAEQAIQKRLTYESMLAEISYLAVREPNDSVFFPIMLKLIGQTFEVSRVYVFNYDDQRKETNNTFEWVAEGITPEIENLQHIPVDTLPWIHDRLFNGHIIDIENVEGVDSIPSKPDKEIILQQSIKSLLIIPLLVSGEYYGAIGLDNCLNQKAVPEEEKVILKTIGSIIESRYELNLANYILQRREQFLDSIYNGIDLSVYVVDVDEQGDLRYAGFNEAHEKITGLTEGEFKEKSPYDLYPKKVAESVVKNLKKCVKQKERLQYEEELPYRGKPYIWETRLHPLIGHSGKVYRIIVTSQEISGRKEAEQALKLSQSRYKTLFELPNDFIFLHYFNPEDGSGKFIEVNDWACERLGYTKAELSLMQPTDIISDDDLNVVPKEKAILKATNELRFYKHLMTKKGEQIPVELHARIFEHQGQTMAISIGRDMTTQIKTQEKIRESEERFKGIFNNMANGVAIYKPLDLGEDFEIKEINRSGSAIMKNPADEIVGNRLSEFSTAAQHMGMMEVLKKVYSSGNAERLSTHITSEQHLDIWLDNYIFRLSNGEIIVVFEDISERIRAREALRKSAEKYRLLANNVTDVIWQMDLKMHFTYVSPSIYNITGYTVSEWLNLHLSDPKSVKTFINLSRQIIDFVEHKNPKETILFESYLTRKDGERIDVEITGKMLTSDKGKLVGIQGIIRDITERKQAELELKTSRESLENIFKASPIGIGIVEGRRFVKVNDAFLNMLGYTPDEIINISTRIIYPSDHEYDRMGKVHYAQIEQKGRAFNVTRFRHKNGKLIDIHLRSKKMDMHEGDNAIIFTALDVTDQLKASEALMQSEEKFRTLISAIKDVFWIISPKFEKIHFLSPSYEDIFGRSTDDLMQDPESWCNLMHEDDCKAYIKIHNHVLETSEAYTAEYRIITPGGVEKWIYEKGFPIHDALGKVKLMAGSSSDITSTKNLEQEHEHLQEQLRQSQKMEAIGQLAGGVAHDFNNILQAVLGYAQLLKDTLEQESSEYECANEIYSGAERAAGLTQQLLAFSRRQIIELAPVQLNKVVDNLCSLINRLISEQVQLEVVLNPELKTMKGDVGQIEQILLNLCINARDAMPEGGRISIKTMQVTFDDEFCQHNNWAQPGQFVGLEITDTGKGIPEEIKDKIFDPFFTTKPLGQGTGLGLATVYGIIKQHNGLINVVSELNRGATFRIYFPATDAAPEGQSQAETFKQTRGNETILIAEDDASLRRLVSKILTDQGYTVLEAEDGQQATEIAEAHLKLIDLVVLDVVMPRKTGKVVMEEVHALKPDLPIIFISGYSSGGIHANFVLEKGLMFIQKPFNIKKLLGKIREILDSKKL